MKTRTFINGLAPLAVCALLVSRTASAQSTAFTATGYVNAVLAPGIVCVDALGQILVRGGVHTARVQGTDARVTGQVFIMSDGAFNADGTANVQGLAYLQVGAWDTAGTNFTPSGALWVGTWRGVEQTNYSFQLSVAGYGVGATIEGWRIEETLTRGPASGPIDPTVPYLYTGTIKPPTATCPPPRARSTTSACGSMTSHRCASRRRCNSRGRHPPGSTTRSKAHPPSKAPGCRSKIWQYLGFRS
jgi:hypothetical protein